MPITTNPILHKTVYTDIDLNFTPNPITGDISIKKDEYAIKQALYNIVRTVFFEKPFHPEYGSMVHDILFEPVTFITKARIKDALINTINNWEYRVTILDIQVDMNNDRNSVGVTIIFKYNESSIPITIDFILYRSR